MTTRESFLLATMAVVWDDHSELRMASATISERIQSPYRRVQLGAGVIPNGDQVLSPVERRANISRKTSSTEDRQYCYRVSLSRSLGFYLGVSSTRSRTDALTSEDRYSKAYVNWVT